MAIRGDVNYEMVLHYKFDTLMKKKQQSGGRTANTKQCKYSSCTIAKNEFEKMYAGKTSQVHYRNVMVTTGNSLIGLI